MHEVLVNRLGGLSLPRKSVVRLTDRSDMTLEVYRGRKTAQQQQKSLKKSLSVVQKSCNLGFRGSAKRGCKKGLNETHWSHDWLTMKCTLLVAVRRL